MPARERAPVCPVGVLRVVRGDTGAPPFPGALAVETSEAPHVASVIEERNLSQRPEWWDGRDLADDTGNRLRFQLELEFVQCLANPNYLNFLAQRGYFKDKAFVNYLKYLLYWKEPEYAKYLKYPQCLHMLELLQYEHFRKELVNAQCAKFIDEQQILHWQHYSRKRMRLQQALAEQQQQNNTSVK
ncbi:mediator of RNA polymerase II transcription subunit 31 isoform X1 [Meleagris gallopavo]|uniref:mediator of RNA polymerase II transcription subunit 31 isoform X1 n=1 Tax=Meleagris gallopavo TaxID=9103 RepID=UPI000549D8E6|nr:mediator of RNA polymerase II transcription subunit 31 isoform X1 [Meleagris gallopavo]